MDDPHLNDHYSPHTGEYIAPMADTADWIARAGVARPDYDPATQSPFWRGDHWEIVASTAPSAEDMLAAAMRAERDARLVTLDALVMNPLRWAAFTADEQAALATYRQALLDVPQQAGFPGVVDWPEMPGLATP